MTYPTYFTTATGYFVCFGTVKRTGSIAWRFPFGMQAVVAAVFAAGASWLPHSPRWLRHVGRQADAAHAWARLGVSRTEAEKEEETTQELQGRSQTSAWQEIKQLWSKNVRGRTTLGCFLMAMNQVRAFVPSLYLLMQICGVAGVWNRRRAILRPRPVHSSGPVISRSRVSCVGGIGSPQRSLHHHQPDIY